MADLTARIKPKKSSTAGEVPQAADLEVAELAVNTADGKLFVKHTDNSIKEISGGGGGGGISGLPNYDGILMAFDGGDQSTTFTEETGKISSWTAGGSVKQVASPVKFGASALSCRSATADQLISNDLVGTSAREQFRINKGDFTVEFWVHIPTGASTNWQNVFMLQSSNGINEIMGCTIRKVSANGLVDSVLFYLDDGNGGAAVVINQQNVDLFDYDTWHHVAFCRSGQVLKYFVDGVEHYSQANTTSVGTSDVAADMLLTLGVNHPLTSERFDGYLDDFYYVPQAKYTGAFTPPTAAIVPLEVPPNDGDVLVYDSVDAGYRAQALPLGYLGDVKGPISNAYTLTNKVTNYLNVANDGDWSTDVWGGAGGGYLISWESLTAGDTVLSAIQAGDEVTIYWPSGEVVTETVAQTYAQSTNNGIVINDPTNSPWNTQALGTALTIQCKTRIETTALAPTDGQVLTYDAANSQWEPQTAPVPDLNEVGKVSYVSPPTSYRYDTYSASLSSNGQWAQDGIGLYVRKIDSDGKDITQDPLYPSTNFWYSTDGVTWVGDSGTVSQSTNFFSWGIGNPGLAQNTLYVSYNDPSLSVQDGQVLTYVAANSQWEAADPAGATELNDLTDVATGLEAGTQTWTGTWTVSTVTINQTMNAAGNMGPATSNEVNLHTQDNSATDRSTQLSALDGQTLWWRKNSEAWQSETMTGYRTFASTLIPQAAGFSASVGAAQLGDSYTLSDGGPAIDYSPTAGQVLTYVDARSRWEPADAPVESNTTTAGAGSSAVSNIVTISQVDYDALGTPDANTIYFIV
ncbi:concanavalin A-like lectin/glucanase superfamily [Synechococcus phage S-CRES3]|nr:concanavalin A-like lectin/glucanase superfamily [Synechococcus phage S-CRES3]